MVFHHLAAATAGAQQLVLKSPTLSRIGNSSPAWGERRRQQQNNVILMLQYVAAAATGTQQLVRHHLN
jgi:hypothetical protein